MPPSLDLDLVTQFLKIIFLTPRCSHTPKQTFVTRFYFQVIMFTTWTDGGYFQSPLFPFRRGRKISKAELNHSYMTLLQWRYLFSDSKQMQIVAVDVLHSFHSDLMRSALVWELLSLNNLSNCHKASLSKVEAFPSGQSEEVYQNKNYLSDLKYDRLCQGEGACFAEEMQNEEGSCT